MALQPAESCLSEADLFFVRGFFQKLKGSKVGFLPIAVLIMFSFVKAALRESKRERE
jgi:hypothetical protein